MHSNEDNVNIIAWTDCSRLGLTPFIQLGCLLSLQHAMFSTSTQWRWNHWQGLRLSLRPYLRHWLLLLHLLPPLCTSRCPHKASHSLTTRGSKSKPRLSHLKHEVFDVSQVYTLHVIWRCCCRHIFDEPLTSQRILRYKHVFKGLELMNMSNWTQSQNNRENFSIRIFIHYIINYFTAFPIITSAYHHYIWVLSFGRVLGNSEADVLACCRKIELSQKTKVLTTQWLYVPVINDGHELWVVTERMTLLIQATKMSFLCWVAVLTLRDTVRSTVSKVCQKGLAEVIWAS